MPLKNFLKDEAIRLPNDLPLFPMKLKKGKVLHLQGDVIVYE